MPIANERLVLLKKYTMNKAMQDFQREKGKLEEPKEEDIVSDSIQFDLANERKFFKLIAVLCKGHEGNQK